MHTDAARPSSEHKSPEAPQRDAVISSQLGRAIHLTTSQQRCRVARSETSTCTEHPCEVSPKFAGQILGQDACLKGFVNPGQDFEGRAKLRLDFHKGARLDLPQVDRSAQVMAVRARREALARLRWRTQEFEDSVEP